MPISSLKCFVSNVVDSQRPMDQLITIGQVDASDTLGANLHYAALNGKKKILKKALDKGINVDYPNDEGQTPLFVASYGGHQSIVNYLLSAGADANEKTNLGLTAIHAACFSGHLKIVMRLLQAGGDLRLHDYQGRSAKDWAILNPNPKKRMKILEFLDKTRMFAMSSSGQDLLLNKASSKTLHRAHHRRNTVTNIIRNKIGRPSIHGNLEKMATSQHTLGFGQVYSHGHDTSGFMSAIPFVNENSLKHDQNGDTFENSGFCVMESVWWDYTKVTAKKLRSDIDPYHGGVVDLLINEIEHIGKLRHPNILTLMGVCQASNLDGLHLIFESIPEGSLFNYMHEQLKRLPTEMIQEIALQICDAIIFIHLRGLVHCSITSHAISIVNPHLFKLGNFEYMIEASKCEWGKKNAVACNTVENAVYNWMAPEVMMAMPASFYCDMYSFCAVLWEMFHGEIPWADECIESIKSNFGKGKGLKMSHGKIIEYFRIILEYGLQQEPTNRKMTFLHVRDILVAAPKDARNYVRTRLKHLHYSDDDSDPPGGRIGRNDDNIHTNHIAQQHQASTSYNIDNAMMRGQMKDRGRYGNKREINQYEYHHHQDGKTKPRWEKTKELKNSPQHYQPNYELHNKHNNEQKKDNFNFQSQPAIQTFGEEQVTSKNLPLRQLNDKRQSPIKQRNISGHHGDIQQSVQQLTYGSDGLKWENLPKEVGEEYIYTVQIKKEESPKKASAPVFERSRNQNSTEDYEAASKYLEFTESETSQEDTSQTGLTTETTSSDSYQFAHGRELERKTSSMGNFSYLGLGNHNRSRSAGAKPACHGQYELVAEEYSSQGKLTTAGSLYSLYNDHSPGKPLGQIESKIDHGHYSTFPRRHVPVNYKDESTTNLDSGNKSVRDLAKLFQQQIAQHTHYQAVLDGTVNRDHSSEKLDHTTVKQNNATLIDDKNYRDYGNHANTSKNYEVSCGLDDFEDSDRKSDSSSTFSTSGSTESECVSKWVDHELHKIKRKLSKEVVKPTSPQKTQSPVLFSSPDTEQGEEVKSSQGSQINKHTLYFSDDECSKDNGHTLQCNGDNNEHEIEEGFFDDELYSDVPREETNYTGTKESTIPVTSNLPMKTIMKKVESPSKSGAVDSESTITKQNKKIRRIPRRIPNSSKEITSKPKSNEGKYANVMTIRSSINEAGKHHLTHTIKNLKTGGSSTMLDEHVSAQRLVAVFRT